MIYAYNSLFNGGSKNGVCVVYPFSTVSFLFKEEHKKFQHSTMSGKNPKEPPTGGAPGTVGGPPEAVKMSEVTDLVQRQGANLRKEFKDGQDSLKDAFANSANEIKTLLTNHMAKQDEQFHQLRLQIESTQKELKEVRLLSQGTTPEGLQTIEQMLRHHREDIEQKMVGLAQANKDMSRRLAQAVSELGEASKDHEVRAERTNSSLTTMATQMLSVKQSIQQLEGGGGGGAAPELVPKGDILSPELWTRGALSSDFSVLHLKDDLHAYFTQYIKQHPITSDGKVQKSVPVEYHHYERYRTVLNDAIDLLAIVAAGQDDDSYQKAVKNIHHQMRLIFVCCLKFMPEEEGGGLNAAKRYEQSLKESKLPLDIREVLEANRVIYRTVQLHKGRDPGAPGPGLGNAERGGATGAPTPTPKSGAAKK